MPRRPDAPCAGGCGTLLRSSSTSLPPGQRTCRPCRAKRSRKTCIVCGTDFQPANPHNVACSPACGQKVRLASRPECAESGCNKRPIGNERCFQHRPGYAEYMRAHYRDQTHRRRRATAEQHTDITPEYERSLRAKAKRCPLCNVRMVAEPYLPASKELDHMIPLNMGGTHTIGNVRIICRGCNARRPSDGSDYQGAVTLWAQAPVELVPQRPARRSQVCECGERKRKGRCWSCQPPRLGRAGMTAEQVHERARRAAEMRDAGIKWQTIADALGFKNTGSAYLAAEAARRRAEQAA